MAWKHLDDDFSSNVYEYYDYKKESEKVRSEAIDVLNMKDDEIGQRVKEYVEIEHSIKRNSNVFQLKRDLLRILGLKNK